MAEQSADDVARAAVLSDVLAPDGMLDLRRLRSFVPHEWASRATVGLDGVLRLSHPDADRGDLPQPVREQLVALAPALSGQQLAGPQALDAVEAAHRLTARLAAARVHATRELTARTGEETLRRKGVTTPEELSATAFTRWRARAKALTAAEVRTATGLGAGTAREVVAVANAPQASSAPAEQGLAAGIAGWDLVLAWWRRCTRLPHESAAAIARALFATGVSADQVAHERLTPDGQVSDAPWPKKVFHTALERLASQHEDPAAQEKKRAAQHAARDAYAVLDDDGTAQLVITGDAASVTACLERLQTIATRARRAGDPRTLSALRSDTARALLLHGTLLLPDLGDEPNLLTPEDITGLADVISGTPAHELQVIVPWDVLTGQAVTTNPFPATAQQTEGRPSDPSSSPPADGRGTAPPTPSDAPPPDAQPATGLTSEGAADAAVPAGVGRTLGRFSRFLSRAEIARIAGRPGTTLYRLLTDPADGRCLERSVARYAPDAAMRAQLYAADVTSRAPGSTVPAERCDLDHVQEYLLGGPTSETNLQAADRPWHALKTEKFWHAVMDRSRNVTWTSFWGRLYPTRPHDYRQYLTHLGPHPSPPPSGASSGPAEGPEPGAELAREEQRHLASLLVYAALTHRDPRARLEATDDDPDSDEALLGLRDAIWIRHTAPDGRRRTGSAPGTPTPEQLIAHDPAEVLDHPDWTTLGQEDGPSPDGDESAGPSPDDTPPPPF